MALKFRRGTTAQKSGSLAFGEPYVNTTIGALQIGLESSDLTIRSVDSSSAVAITSLSASSFVSASSLKVTGDASIDGNLSLGGNITIGDATSDTLNVVANLSSSLIPSVTNAFDLGSADKIWKDLYISTGSIKFVGNGSVVSTLNPSVLSGFSSATASTDAKFNTLATYTGSVDTRLTQIGVISGSLISSASSFETRNASLATISGSLIASASSFETRNANLATITGSLIASASSFETRNASLATISGSLISTASNNTQRLTAIEAVSGSWITESETSSFSRTNTSNTFEGDQAVTGNLVVTGSITANEFHITLVSSSVMYASGSNTFGNSVDDLQQLIGIVEITGSIKGTQFNDLATITGSLIASASSFESRNASLATISGSLISTASNHEGRLDVFEGESGSYARNNTANSFLGNQTITGSLVTSGSLVEFNVQWPAAPGEQHIIKTAPFTLDGREYEYAGFALTHYEDSPGTLHNSMAMYMFDPTNTFGSEIVVGPYRTHMQSYPSGSGGNVANISVQDLKDGRTQALVYGDFVQIGAYHAESIIIGNDNSITQISGSIRNAQLTAIGTITGSLISSASSFETRNASLATITGSLIITASNNVVSITNLNTFSSSQLTKDSTLATYTGSVETRLTEIGVVSGSLISSASAAKTTNDSQDVSITNLNTFSGSQLTKDSTLQTYTASVDTRLTEIGVVSGSLISSASAAKTKNDSQDVSLTNLNSYTASLQAGIQMTGSTVSILGDLKVYGTQSVITSTNVQIQDNIIYLSPTASIDNDLGIVGHYNDGTYRHAGIFMDASDGHSWKVFNGLQDETSALIDTNGTGFTLADFKAGAITGTSFNGTINATNGVISGSSQVNADSITNFDTNVKDKLNVDGVISGSSQIISILGSLNTYTGSNDTTNTTQNTRLTALEASASTALSTNNTQATSITNLNSTTASLLIETANLEAFSASALTRLSNLEGTDISITLTGDVTGTGTITNLANVSFATTIAANSVALGTDTTGDYVASLVAGTGVTLSNNSGEGATPTIAIGQSVATNATPTFGNLTINGTITATGDITAYYTSDRRHKNNIKIIPNALSKVTKLNGVTWEWNDDVNEVTKSTPKTGLIAQEVQEVLPEVVVERENGYLGLDYSKMVGLLVEAIKEQQIKIDNLTIEVEKLKKQKGL